MDKKEFEGNEQLNNNATPEETAASANNNEASVEAEPVFTAADETVPAAQAAVEPDSNPAAPETVPVMSKVGGGSTPLHPLKAARAG